MKRHEAYKGSFLKSQDLEGDYTVTIKSCQMEAVGQGEDMEDKPVLAFDETDQKLILNQTNWDSIADLHGEDSDEWTGQQITLFVDPKVRFGNKVVPAIRVRNKIPPLAGRAQKQPASENGLLTYEQAVELCKTVGVPSADMMGYLKGNGLTRYTPQLCTPFVRKLVAGLTPPPDDPEPEDELNSEKDPLPF